MTPQARQSLSRTPIVAMLVVSSLTVAGMAALSWKNGRDRAAASEELTVSRQIQEAADDLLSTVKNAETGQRGYLLTGRDKYLDSYHSAVARMTATLSNLRATAAARPDQAERARALEPLVLGKMRELAATVELRRSQGFAAALATVETDQGKTDMDGIRNLCATMREVADRRLATFSATAEDSARRLQIVATIGSLVLLGFLSISSVTILRGIAQRDELYHRAASNAELLRITLTCIGDAVVATDARARITFINPVGQALTGWAEEEAIGAPIDQVFRIVNETTRGVVENPAEKAMQTGAVVGLANHTVLIAKQGNEIAIDDSGAPIRDPSGAVVGAIVVFRDISERRSTERQLQESNEQLRQFVTAAAHDLRAPLNSAHAVTELLARHLESQIDAEGERLLGYVRNGVRRILRLVDDLLAYAQASHFELDEGRRTPMETAMHAVLENLRADIESSAATVTAGPLPVVAVHEAHLVLLLQNLIGNALKYRGDAPPAVRVDARRMGPEWVVGVSDNGIGIQPEYAADIFKPFKRLHGDDRPGSGIGLATCQKIVTGYGGRIWVTSDLGQGSTFFFSLPDPEEGDA